MSDGKQRTGPRTREFAEQIYPTAGGAIIVVTATNWFTATKPATEVDSATLWGMVPHQGAAGFAAVAMMLAGLACLTFAAHRSAIAVGLLSVLAVIGIGSIMSVAGSAGYSLSDGLWLGLVFCLAVPALTVLPHLETVRPPADSTPPDTAA